MAKCNEGAKFKTITAVLYIRDESVKIDPFCLGMKSGQERPESVDLKHICTCDTMLYPTLGGISTTWMQLIYPNKH